MASSFSELALAFALLSNFMLHLHGYSLNRLWGTVMHNNYGMWGGWTEIDNHELEGIGQAVLIILFHFTLVKIFWKRFWKGKFVYCQ